MSIQKKLKVCEQLKAITQKEGYSASEIGSACGVTQCMISRYIVLKTLPNKTTLPLLQAFTNKSPEERRLLIGARKSSPSKVNNIYMSLERRIAVLEDIVGLVNRNTGVIA